MSARNQKTHRPSGNVCPLCYNTGRLASDALCICQEMPATVRPDDDATMPPVKRSEPTVRFRQHTRRVSELAAELHERADADATARDHRQHYDRNR